LDGASQDAEVDIVTLAKCLSENSKKIFQEKRDEYVVVCGDREKRQLLINVCRLLVKEGAKRVAYFEDVQKFVDTYPFMVARGREPGAMKSKYPKEVVPGVYIGKKEEVTTKDLQDMNITHVVDFDIEKESGKSAEEAKKEETHKSEAKIKLPEVEKANIEDGDGKIDPDSARKLVEEIGKRRKDQEQKDSKVLLIGSKGNEAPPLTALIVLVTERKMSPEDAYDELLKAREDLPSKEELLKKLRELLGLEKQEENKKEDNSKDAGKSQPDEDAQARLEAEKKAREEAEKAKEAAERAAKEAADKMAKEAASQKEKDAKAAKKAADEKKAADDKKKAEEEAAKKAKEDAEAKAKEDAEKEAKKEAARFAKAEVERKAKEAAEKKAKEEADKKAKEEAKRLAKEAEEIRKKEEAERKRQEEEEAKRKAKEEAERKEKERLAKIEADKQAKEEAEKKRREEERRQKEAEEKRKQEEEERKEAERCRVPKILHVDNKFSVEINKQTCYLSYTIYSIDTEKVMDLNNIVVPYDLDLQGRRAPIENKLCQAACEYAAGQHYLIKTSCVRQSVLKNLQNAYSSIILPDMLSSAGNTHYLHTRQGGTYSYS